MNTIRTLLARETQYKWLAYQFYVKASFQNGVLKYVYDQHPKVYEVK
jgi:hypothetical protein